MTNDRPVTYQADGIRFEGVLVEPYGSGTTLPGLLLAPSWLGVTEDAIDRARAIAGRGYVVLVSDVYGADRRPSSMEEAAGFAAPLRADPVLTRRRMRAALDALEREGAGLLDAGPRAAIGYCFGGGNVFELARAGAPIAAAVSFHGDLVSTSPARPSEVRAALLALHGADDPVAPKADRDAFEAEMTAAGADWQLLAFGGVVHAFTDVGVDAMPVARYDGRASRIAHDLADRFIREAMAQPR